MPSSFSKGLVKDMDEKDSKHCERMTKQHQHEEELMSIILSLDIGSSSVRCSAYNFNRPMNKAVNVEAIRGCSSCRPIKTIQNDGEMIVCDHSVLDEIDSVVDETLQRLRDVNDSKTFHVAAVAFTTFVCNLIGIDSDGNVVPGASVTYACNSTRVIEQCRLLQRETDSENWKKIHQRTGCPLHSAYALPQLRAFYEHPSSRNVHTWQTIASLVLSRWTGVKSLPISYSEASWTGLFNIHTCQWEAGILSYLQTSCQEALPRLQDSTEPVMGGICEFLTDNTDPKKNLYWERWPEMRADSSSNRRCELFLGLADGAAANLGSKCTSFSRIAVTIGTSAAARICLWHSQHEEITVPTGLWCYRITKDLVLLGGALTDGGSVIEFCRNLLNLNQEIDFAACMQEVANLLQQDYNGECQSSSIADENRSNNEIFLPFLGGERSTGFRFGATGAMCGMTKSTTPAHFVKSCMEGVTLRLNEILKLILSSIVIAPNPKEEHENPILVVSGSALEKNAIWRQMIADCSEMVVITDSDVTECTSRGAARLAAAALCSISVGSTTGKGIRYLLGEEPLMPIDQCEPSFNAKKKWTAATRAQNELIDLMSSTWRSP